MVVDVADAHRGVGARDPAQHAWPFRPGEVFVAPLLQCGEHHSQLPSGGGLRVTVQLPAQLGHEQATPPGRRPPCLVSLYRVPDQTSTSSTLRSGWLRPLSGDARMSGKDVEVAIVVQD